MAGEVYVLRASRTLALVLANAARTGAFLPAEGEILAGAARELLRARELLQDAVDHPEVRLRREFGTPPAAQALPSPAPPTATDRSIGTKEAAARLGQPRGSLTKRVSPSSRIRPRKGSFSAGRGSISI
jgi:hypothetical protein